MLGVLIAVVALAPIALGVVPVKSHKKPCPVETVTITKHVMSLGGHSYMWSDTTRSVSQNRSTTR